MASDDTTTLNAPPTLRERHRTLRSGKQKSRFTIEVQSEPLVHNFDPKVLSEKPAEAIKNEIATRIGKVKRRVARATIARRRSARKEFDRGSRTAKKRYSGGRIGATPPEPNAEFWLNDSGRLREGLFTRWNRTDKSWTTNVPANRLHRESFGRGFDAFVEEFEKLIDIPAIVSGRPFDRALADASIAMIVKYRALAAAKRAELRRMGFRAARGAISALLT